MRQVVLLVVATSLACASTPPSSTTAASRDVAPRPPELLSWPRMRADSFGCMLEKRLGYRHEKFNCSLQAFSNKGDPCVCVRENYEGPAVPELLARSVDPRIRRIELAWEHGDLQAVSIDIAGHPSVSEVEALFGLPTLAPTSGDGIARLDYPKTHPNLSAISLQPQRDSVTLVLEGFDHQGAGDADCSEVTPSPGCDARPLGNE